MKRILASMLVLVMAISCAFTGAVQVQAAAVSTKDVIGTWKSADGIYTLGIFKKNVIKIKSGKSDKWVTGTWSLSASKKIVTIKENTYLNDKSKFKYTSKKLTASSDSKFYFSKTSDKTPSTGSKVKESDLVGTWSNGTYSMILAEDGQVYMKVGGEPYEEVTMGMGTWKLDAAKSTVVIPDYIYSAGKTTYKYTKDKLTVDNGTGMFYSKVSSSTSTK